MSHVVTEDYDHWEQRRRRDIFRFINWWGPFCLILFGLMIYQTGKTYEAKDYSYGLFFLVAGVVWGAISVYSFVKKRQR